MTQTTPDAAPAASPAGQPRRRRHPRRAVAIGIVAAALPTTLFLLAAFGVVGGGPLSDVARLVLLAVGLAPLIVGVLLWRTEGTPQRRGVGFGLALGWLLWVVVIGGTLLIGLLILLSRMFTFRLNGVGIA